MIHLDLLPLFPLLGLKVCVTRPTLSVLNICIFKILPASVFCLFGFCLCAPRTRLVSTEVRGGLGALALEEQMVTQVLGLNPGPLHEQQKL